MWRTLPLDIRVRLIREGHIDLNADDADLGDDILGVDDNIAPASAVEPGWKNDTSASASAWSNSTPGDVGGWGRHVESRDTEDDARAWATWTSASPEPPPVPTPDHDLPSFITPSPP